MGYKASRKQRLQLVADGLRRDQILREGVSFSLRRDWLMVMHLPLFLGLDGPLLKAILKSGL